MCPSNGDVKSEVPCSLNATPVQVKDPFSSSSLFGAMFVKSRENYVIPVFDVYISFPVAVQIIFYDY